MTRISYIWCGLLRSLNPIFKNPMPSKHYIWTKLRLNLVPHFKNLMGQYRWNMGTVWVEYWEVARDKEDWFKQTSHVLGSGEMITGNWSTEILACALAIFSRIDKPPLEVVRNYIEIFDQRIFSEFLDHHWIRQIAPCLLSLSGTSGK